MQYFFLADDKYELGEERWCSFGKGAIIEGKPSTALVFSWQRGYLMLTTSWVAFFYPPSSHLQKKNKFFISTIFLPHFFPAILVSKPSDRNKVAFTFPLEFDLIRFDVWVNAELNYLGRPKVVLGSAHVEFDVLIGPYRVLRVPKWCETELLSDKIIRHARAWSYEIWRQIGAIVWFTWLYFCSHLLITGVK